MTTLQDKAFEGLTQRQSDISHAWCPNLQKLHTGDFSELLDKLFYFWSAANQLVDQNEIDGFESSEHLLKRRDGFLSDYLETKAIIEKKPYKYTFTSASGKSGPAFDTQLDYDMTIADFEIGTGRM